MSQEVAEGRCFPFMPLAWIIGRDALCQVDRGGQLPSKPAIITIREAAALFSRFFFSVSEMFIYATDSPKDTEEPLLQVVTAQPPHIIHFLHFNLVVLFFFREGGGQNKKKATSFEVYYTLQSNMSLFNFRSRPKEKKNILWTFCKWLFSGSFFQGVWWWFYHGTKLTGEEISAWIWCSFRILDARDWDGISVTACWKHPRWSNRGLGGIDLIPIWKSARRVVSTRYELSSTEPLGHHLVWPSLFLTLP